jgi:hypothetical protein
VYGGKCVCPGCDVTEPTFLVIDHIFNDGFKERSHGSVLPSLKRRGYPRDRYQLLCHNCNHAKRLGTCPHVQRVKGVD